MTCYTCHQNDCEDQEKASGAATVKCHLCERCFFCPTCFSHHLHLDDKGQETETNSVCQTYKKCGSCGKVLTGKEKTRKKHIFGYTTCPCCQEYLNIYTHQCYLQPVEDEEKKRKRRQRKRKHGEQCLAANDPEFEPQEDRPPPPPLFVYFDIEAHQEGGVHVENLLCAERHDDNEQFVFEVEECLESFWTGYEN